MDIAHPHPGPARAHDRAARARPRARRRRPRRCHARHGRPRRGVPRALPELTVIGLDRDTDALAHRRASGSRRSATGSRSCTPCTTASARPCEPSGFDEVAGHPVRPRRLVAAARSRRARLRLLEGRAARHAHGRHARPHGGRRARRVRARTSCAASSSDYGEEKLAARYARAIVRARAEAPITRSGELVEIITAATPAAVQRSRAPGQARVPGAAHRGQRGAVGARARRSPPRSTRSPSAAGSSCWRTSRSRTASSSASSQAAASSTAPAGLPVELPEHRPEFRLLVRGAELASEAEQAENPRAKPVRLRAAERVRRPS